MTRTIYLIFKDLEEVNYYHCCTMHSKEYHGVYGSFEEAKEELCSLFEKYGEKIRSYKRESEKSHDDYDVLCGVVGFHIEEEVISFKRSE